MKKPVIKIYNLDSKNGERYRRGLLSSYMDMEAKSFLPRRAKYFFTAYGLSSSTHGHVAVCENKVVGFFRYDSSIYGSMYSNGTWVEKSFRRFGVAAKLWAAALRAYKPKKLFVVTATPAGCLFVDYVRRHLLKNCELRQDCNGNHERCSQAYTPKHSRSQEAHA